MRAGSSDSPWGQRDASSGAVADFALAGKLMPLGCEVRSMALAGMSSTYEALAHWLQLLHGGRNLPALDHYSRAGLREHAQRLAVRLLQGELEPTRREPIARLRGSRSVERFAAVPTSRAWSSAA